MKTAGNKKLWAIHSWVGLYFGIIIAILSVSGAAALFKDEFDHLLNPRLHYVTERGPHVSLTATAQRLQAANPDYNFQVINLPQRPDGTWELMFYKNQKGALDTENKQIHVNPYTGEVLGERDYYKSFAFFLRNLHVRLYESNWGRQIVGLAGIALFIISLTGLLIYGSFMKKQAFAAIRTKNIRVFVADWHKLIGIVALAFNLMIAGTGAWLGLQPKLMKWVGMKTPNEVALPTPFTKEADQALPVDYNQALRVAQGAFPDLVPASISSSTSGEGIVEISGDIRGQVVEKHVNKLMLDKVTGREVARYDVRQGSLGGKFYFLQEALHFGDFGGLLLKLLYCLFALTSGILSITGFVIYLKRNEKKLPSRVAEPVGASGADRRQPTGARRAVRARHAA